LLAALNICIKACIPVAKTFFGDKTINGGKFRPFLHFQACKYNAKPFFRLRFYFKIHSAQLIGGVHELCVCLAVMQTDWKCYFDCAAATNSISDMGVKGLHILAIIMFAVTFK